MSFGRPAPPDSDYTGFATNGDYTCLFVDGVEHTYWQLDTLERDERHSLDKARATFARKGLDATLKFLNTPW